MEYALIAVILLIAFKLLIIACIAWTHAPFTFMDFWQDFLIWIKRKPDKK